MKFPRFKVRGVRTCLAASLFVAASIPGALDSAWGQEPQVAPLIARQTSDAGPANGFIPPPGDLSHIRAPMPDAPLPILSRFDWREAATVTPVKNQGSCGSCYAFASVANFESKVLIDGGGTFDLSENNVKECEWWGSSCYGGNFWRVASFLAAEGTVLETCDPYVAADVACNTSCAYETSLLDWRVISTDVPAGVDVLKTYLQTYGPIYTTMYAGNGDAWRSEFQAYDGTYTLYYPGTESTNHAVLIVGWDDDLIHAGGQGGWIVKNSWGAWWGGTCGYGTEGGYFTIAYGSAQIGAYASFIYDWQAYDPNGSVMYYDEAGYTSSVGYGNATCWGLCKFVPGEDIEVERVEFWTVDATPDVDVYIYDDFNGSSVSNLLVSKLNSTFDNAGYHSVELDTPLDVDSGQDIYAVVKIRDDSYIYPMVFDQLGPKATGCCYISPTGATFSAWSSGDLGIRLRTTQQASCGGIIEEPAILAVEDVPGDSGGHVEITWKRSIYDQEEATPQVKRYKVWRRRKPIPSALLTQPAISGPSEHGETGPAWEHVSTVQATGDCCYGLVAATQCDSSASDTCWTYYRVTAHTGQVGDHYDSSVGRGYSVDDLGLLKRSFASDAHPAGPPEALPDAVHLAVPQPNPGDGVFSIHFDLARADWIQVDIYNVSGQRVARLKEGFTEAGSHVAMWDPDNDTADEPSPGLYFVRLVTTLEAHTAKLMLVR